MTITPTVVYVAAAALMVVIVVLGTSAYFRRKKKLTRPQNPYVEALTHLIDGRQDEAFLKLRRVVESGIAPVDAYIRLGNMLRDRGDATKALQIHKSLTVKTDLTRGEKIKLFAGIARDYSALGKPDRAINILETALKRMNLREPRVFSMLAKECHALGDTEKAYHYLKELMKTGAIGDRELSLFLGSAAEQKMESGDLKEARKMFQRSLKHDPNNAAALLESGNLEDKLGNQDGAIAQWKKVALLSSELDAAALQNLEKMMFERGTFNVIERVYREVLDARPLDEYATLALASFYKKQGRGEDAIALTEEFCAAYPHSIGGTLLLTSLYATQRDPEVLEKFLEENETTFSETGRFHCGNCEYESARIRWHCPQCNSFDSFIRTHEN